MLVLSLVVGSDRGGIEEGLLDRIRSSLASNIQTTYGRIRASLSEPETDDTIHRYGAWLFAPPNSSRLSTAKSLGLSLQSAHGKPNSGRSQGEAPPEPGFTGLPRLWRHPPKIRS